MISGLTNGGIIAVQVPSPYAVTGVSSDMDEQDTDEATTTSAATATVSSQPASATIRAQDAIVSSMLNLTDVTV